MPKYRNRTEERHERRVRVMISVMVVALIVIGVAATGLVNL